MMRDDAYDYFEHDYAMRAIMLSVVYHVLLCRAFARCLCYAMHMLMHYARFTRCHYTPLDIDDAQRF